MKTLKNLKSIHYKDRFRVCIDLAKEAKSLKKTPKTLFESYKNEIVRLSIPKDKNLRKKGHIVGAINDFLNAIQEIYGERPFVDFNTELERLYNIYLPNKTYTQNLHIKQKEISEKEFPKTPFKKEESSNVIKIDMGADALENKSGDAYDDSIILIPENKEGEEDNLIDINEMKKNMVPPKEGLRNQVFKPASIDLNKLNLIKNTVQSTFNLAQKYDIHEESYQPIEVDESKYTEKVDPEIAKFLGINEDGEI